MSNEDHCEVREWEGEPVPLSSLTEPGIVLELEKMRLTFDDVEAFKLAIETRTELPPERRAAIESASPEVLANQARTLRAVEGVLLEVLERTITGAAAVGEQLSAIDPRCFSLDHDWYGMFAALALQGPEFDPYKQAALVTFVQYLAVRQEQLARSYAVKTLAAARAAPDKVRASTDAPDQAFEEDTTEIPVAMDETSIFDGRRLRPDRDAVPKGATPLPRGEPCLVRQAPGEEIALWLSNFRFRLVVCAEPPSLVDEAGSIYPLPEGEFTVGRGKQCDVVVDRRNSNVSRRHLLCELVDEDLVSITDLSSHGTFLERTEPEGKS